MCQNINEEAFNKILDMVKEDPRLNGPFNDFVYVMRHPDRMAFPSTILHAKIGENSVWSFRYFLDRLNRCIQEDLYRGERGMSYKEVYYLTGDWNVCDECGEITLCSHALQNLKRECIYCRAKDYVFRCIDKSEMDAPIVKFFLNSGVINPLEKWVSDKAWEDFDKFSQMSPIIPITNSKI